MGCGVIQDTVIRTKKVTKNKTELQVELPLLLSRLWVDVPDNHILQDAGLQRTMQNPSTSLLCTLYSSDQGDGGQKFQPPGDPKLTKP